MIRELFARWQQAAVHLHPTLGRRAARSGAIEQRMRKIMILGLALIASGICVAKNGADAQTAPQLTLPLSRPQAQYYSQHPDQLNQLLDQLSRNAQQFTPAQPLSEGVTPVAGGWTTLAHSPGTPVQNPILMTDGTVIAMAACTGHWYKLTPDNTGSYINGAWTQIATMPGGYGPLFGGSGVLPDGRVVFEGGEYNDSSQSGTCGNGVWTTLGAIYNPANNTWTNINPPSGWTEIGDAAGIVLDNGTFMQSDCCDTSGVSGLSALLNASNLTWTTTGSGKLDRWDEEGMAKLQTGGILDVDAHTNNSCSPFTSEIYNQSSGTWSATGNTPDQQADCSNPGNDFSYELGPLVVRQDGSAVSFPGVLCADKANANCSSQASGYVVIGKADVYNPGAGTWSTLATIPQIGTSPNNYYYSLADAPAAVLPDGNVLFAASPDYQAFVSPKHYFELSFSSPGTITPVNDTADASSCGAYTDNFLLLPTGQVLNVSQCGNIQIYTPLAGSPQASWAPVVKSLQSSCLAPGSTYTASGTQLNGLTEGSYYGDDVQAAVNFPVIRIVNNSTGHVFYAKTFNHSTRSIAPNVSVTTSFTVAGATETGPSILYDVGAGIASAGTPVNISSRCPLTLSHNLNVDLYSDILWRDTGGDVAVWEMAGGTILGGVSLGNVTTDWSVVGTRDFNGDGVPDLLWRNTSGDVWIWLMNSSVTAAQKTVIGNVPTVWSVVGTGDFNGDGKGDILWHDTSGDVKIWFMNGLAVSEVPITTIPTVWSIAGVGDFNGDGKSDILWHDTGGDVTIWEMSGGTILGGFSLGNVTTNWSIVGTGDFNGDGYSDILWRDTAGDVMIQLISNATLLQKSVLGNVPTTWSVAETGDYNGDGKSDILWLDSSGNVMIWFMNGFAVSAVNFGNVGTPWSVSGANAD